MQVFVPHDTYRESVRVLDQPRLGKQRVETLQLVLASLELGLGQRPVLDKHGDPKFKRNGKPETEWDGTFFHRPPKGWLNHPARLAWADALPALLDYQRATVAEWVGRGYSDTCLVKTERAYEFANVEGDATPPWWWGRPDVHASHRAALLHKHPEWYTQWGWTEVPAYAYVWPHELAA